MVFTSLVESIIKLKRDPDDTLAQNTVHTLSRELKSDLVRAYDLSRPLIKRNATLFWESKSFLDFMLRLIRIPPLFSETEREMPLFSEAERFSEPNELNHDELKKCLQENQQLLIQHQQRLNEWGQEKNQMLSQFREEIDRITAEKNMYEAQLKKVGTVEESVKCTDRLVLSSEPQLEKTTEMTVKRPYVLSDEENMSLDDTENLVERLGNENFQLNSALVEVRDENNRLKSALNQEEELKSLQAPPDHSLENEKLKGEITKLKSTIATLIFDLESCKAQLASSTEEEANEMVNLESKYKMLKEDMLLQDDLSRATIKDLKHKSDKCNLELESARHMLALERGQKEAEIEKLNLDRQSLENDTILMMQKIDLLETTLNSKAEEDQEQISSLNQTIKSQAIYELNTESNRAREQISSLNQTIKSQEKAIYELNTESNRAREKINSLNQKIKSQENAIHDNQAASRELNAQIKSYKNVIDQLKATQKKEIDELELQLESELRESNQQSQKNINELRAEIQDCEKRLERLNSELNLIQQESQERIEAFNDENTLLQNQIKEWDGEIMHILQEYYGENIKEGFLQDMKLKSEALKQCALINESGYLVSVRPENVGIRVLGLFEKLYPSVWTEFAEAGSLEMDDNLLKNIVEILKNWSILKEVVQSLLQSSVDWFNTFISLIRHHETNIQTLFELSEGASLKMLRDRSLTLSTSFEGDWLTAFINWNQESINKLTKTEVIMTELAQAFPDIRNDENWKNEIISRYNLLYKFAQQFAEGSTYQELKNSMETYLPYSPKKKRKPETLTDRIEFLIHEFAGSLGIPQIHNATTLETLLSAYFEDYSTWYRDCLKILKFDASLPINQFSETLNSYKSQKRVELNILRGKEKNLKVENKKLINEIESLRNAGEKIKNYFNLQNDISPEGILSTIDSVLQNLITKPEQIDYSTLEKFLSSYLKEIESLRSVKQYFNLQDDISPESIISTIDSILQNLTTKPEQIDYSTLEKFLSSYFRKNIIVGNKRYPREEGSAKRLTLVENYSMGEIQHLFSLVYQAYFVLKLKYLTNALPSVEHIREEIKTKLEFLINPKNMRENQLFKLYKMYIEYDLTTVLGERVKTFYTELEKPKVPYFYEIVEKTYKALHEIVPTNEITPFPYPDEISSPYQ